VAICEDHLWSIMTDLSELAPRRSTGERSSDEINWWVETIQNLTMATISLSALLSDLEERAGLDAESLQREREQRRGLLPCEEAGDKGTETAEGATI